MSTLSRPHDRDLLTRLRAAGFHPYLRGEDGAQVLKIRATRDPLTGELPPLPETLRTEVRQNTETLINRLIAERWTDRRDTIFEARLRDGFNEAEAERLAWNATLWEYHYANMAKPAPHACPYCNQPLDPEQPNVPAGDGAITHPECVIGYWHTWRLKAAEALVRLGITPPESEKITPPSRQTGIRRDNPPNRIDSGQ